MLTVKRLRESTRECGRRERNETDGRKEKGWQKGKTELEKTDWMRESKNCRGRRSCRPKRFIRAAMAASLSVNEEQRCGCQLRKKEREKGKLKKKAQQCHVLLHHWVGLEDSGPTPDERSHMPLGCIPFYWAQLAFVHACNYLYSICVQGIV